MQTALTDLIKTVEKNWRAADYAEPLFAGIAAEALVKVAPHRNLGITGQLAQIARAEVPQEELPGSHVAEGVIPLFTGSRFSVCLHIWYDDVANPHSHAWAGAYQLLMGNSVQAEFSFTEQRLIDPKFSLGHLALQKVDVLGPGDTVAVVQGPGMIHGLSYVHRPGMALSLRTVEDFGGLSNEYWSPGIAFETGFLDDGTERRIKCLKALYAADPALCGAVLESATLDTDLRSSFFLLRYAMANFRQEIDVKAIARRGRYPELFEAVLTEMDRDALLRRVRSGVRDHDQRFLLCALQFARNRYDVIRLVSQLYPQEDPQRFIARCVLGMSATQSNGGRTLLGTPVSADMHAVLELLLEDCRPDSVLSRLSAAYDVEDIRRHESLLRQVCQGFLGQPLLRPLFH